MIVQLRPDAPPSLTDLDRLDRLHAECEGAPGEMTTGALCELDDDGDHVWLHIAAARAFGATAVRDPAWPERFDDMIAYARSKGWTNDNGTHVRAHVEQPGR